MKKLFVLIAFLVSGLGAFAQSMLKISLADNSRFNISLNGRYFNKNGQSITVGDLPPGRQRLKIYAIVRNRWGRLVEEVVYQGRVTTYNGMATKFVYDPDTRMADIQEMDIQPNTTPRYRPAMPQPIDNNAARQSQPTASPVAEGKNGTLTAGKLQKLKTQANAKATDTEKMKVLKNSLRNEQMTTYNVSEVMDWFIFESSKADFAIWAYNLTLDRQQYHDLMAKLKTDNAKQDLDRFIKSKQ